MKIINDYFTNKNYKDYEYRINKDYNGKNFKTYIYKTEHNTWLSLRLDCDIAIEICRIGNMVVFAFNMYDVEYIYNVCKWFYGIGG